MKRETGLRTIVLIGVLLLCIWSLVPTLLVFTKSNDPSLPLEQRTREIYKKEHPTVASKALNLGLDLAGGTHIIVEIDKSKLDESAQRDVLDRCLEIIRNRVDQYGLSEPVIAKSGNNRIVADLAGMDAEDARKLIGATALLEFKLVPEPQEFKPVLDKLDAFLAARKKGLKPGAADLAAAVKPSSSVENVFGRVVSDTGATTKPAAISAMGDTTKKNDTAVAATRQGVDFFLPKPFSPEDLEGVVETLLRHKHARVEAERLRAEAQRDPSDRGQRALISAAVATPEVAAKHAAWARLFVPDGYGSVVRTTAAVAGFAWPWQRELLAPYLRQLPEALLALGAADSTFARNWFRAASLGLWGDPAAALAAIDAFLVNVDDPAHAIPEVDAARLRRLGLTERDALQRILRQRALAAR